MECNIIPMTLSHFDCIQPNLITDFDDFWTTSTLKQELENPNSHYFVAISGSTIVGFAGIWKAVDEYHITNIVVKKDCRRKGIGSRVIGKTDTSSKI